MFQSGHTYFIHKKNERYGEKNKLYQESLFDEFPIILNIKNIKN